MAFNFVRTAMASVIHSIKKEIIKNGRTGDPDIIIKECRGLSGSICQNGSYCRVTRDGIVEYGLTSSGSSIVYVGLKAKVKRSKAIFSPLGKVYPPVKLSFSEAGRIAGNIDSLLVGSVHANVKDDAQWKKIYGVKSRDMAVIDKHGTEGTKPFTSCACHNCGLILPMESIQVDHYMPQAGDEDFYTLKMLRAMSMTEDAATGGKGAQVDAILKGTAAAIASKGNEIGDYQFSHVSSPVGKWTTNDKGKAFLSLLSYEDGALSSFKRLCKNSVLNLAPLCAQCNKDKDDRIKPIR